MVKAIILPHNMIAFTPPRNVYIPMAKLRNFGRKTAETMFFLYFPLVFSRKSIIFVAKIEINGCHANRSRKRKTSITRRSL